MLQHDWPYYINLSRCFDFTSRTRLSSTKQKWNTPRRAQFACQQVVGQPESEDITPRKKSNPSLAFMTWYSFIRHKMNYGIRVESHQCIVRVFDHLYLSSGDRKWKPPMGRDQRRLNNRHLESSVVSSLYFVTKTPYPNVLLTTRAPFLLVPLQCEESLIYFAEKGECRHATS